MSRHEHYQPQPPGPLSLFDVPVPVHSARHGDETERLAAAKMDPVKGEVRLLVLADLKAAGSAGLSGDELCAMHPDYTEYSLRPRLTELAHPRFGLAYKSHMKRENRRGNSERVYVAK